MHTKGVYLGVDVGSVSTNVVALEPSGKVLAKVYRRTQGQPIPALKDSLRVVRASLGAAEPWVLGVGATGSGRSLASVVAGADTVRNEITAHAVAAVHEVPEVRTILEIGGQDSKLIQVRDGLVQDFSMNTVCAAGTGSFLDQQASRLGVPIEEFGGYALRAATKVRIAGRCTVFAESDMIAKQQFGFPTEDIIGGLCDALVRNYLSNLARGRRLSAPFVFQGGVAANVGIKAAFERELGNSLIVPEHYDVMGAVGAALLAKTHLEREGAGTSFRGWDASNLEFRPSTFECNHCANRCEVVRVDSEGVTLAMWGDRCGRWTHTVPASPRSDEAPRAAGTA